MYKSNKKYLYKMYSFDNNNSHAYIICITVIIFLCGTATSQNDFWIHDCEKFRDPLRRFQNNNGHNNNNAYVYTYCAKQT